MASDSEINVRVTATVDDFAGGIKGATSSTDQFTEALNKAAAAAQQANPQAFKALAQDLNAGVITVKEFEASLGGLSAASQAAAVSATTLNEASHLSAGGLRELIVVSRELASGNLTRLPGSLSILATRLGGIPPQAILAGAAIAGIGYALFEAVDSSQKFEAELAKIQNALTASGQGDSFDTSKITQYVDDLRQLPGVSRDAATVIIGEFARIHDGAEIMPQLRADLAPFAQLIGKDIPQAAKEMASAFNDPYEGMKKLEQQGVEFSAEAVEQMNAMHAVNDVAGEQRVLFEALSGVLGKMVDTGTSIQKFWKDFGLSIDGENEKVAAAVAELNKLADAYDKAGNASLAAQTRMRADDLDPYGFKTRNLPDPAGQQAKQAASLTITPSQEQIDQAQTAREENDAIKDGLALYEKGNSDLKEKEEHQNNLLRLQNDLTAAVAKGDGDAAQKIQAQIDQENKLYALKVNRSDRPEDKADEAEAKVDAEAADARIKSEQQVVEEKARLGQLSSADALKQLNELAAQEHEINLRRIADMRAVYARQGDRAGLASTAGQLGAENARYAEQQNANAKTVRGDQERIGSAQDDAGQSEANQRLQTKRAEIQQEAELGQISAQQEYDQLADVVRQELALQEQKFDRLAALYQDDAAKSAEIAAQKVTAEENAQRQLIALQTRLTKANEADQQREQEQYQQTAQRMLQPWENALTQMTDRTKTWQQAVDQAGLAVQNQFVSTFVKNMVNSWLLGETQKTAATVTGNAIRTSSNTIADASSAASAASSMKGTVMNHAYSTAAAVYDDVSQIPYVGWVLAPAAAAGAFAAVAGFGMDINSGAGGYIVPSDQIMKVHENERVLPARYSAGLDAMVGNAAQSGSQSRGDTHLHVHVAAHGKLSPDDIDGLHDSVMKSFKKMARNGGMGSMVRT